MNSSRQPPVVYCGPAIPGAAVPFTTYTNGLPPALAEAVRKTPALDGLIVPLAELPEVRRQLQAGRGRYFTLYQSVQNRRRNP